MVEIKKIFGFMLIGVCFYYLNNIVPHIFLLFIVSSFILLTGIYYFWQSHKTPSSGLKKFNGIFGFVLICLAIVTFGYTLQEHFFIPSAKIQPAWHTDYDHAFTLAQQENKLIFLDFWAEYCSVCKAINKKVFGNQQVVELFKNIIAVNINGTNDNSEPYNTLKKKYNILGFPTFLVIDPKTGKVIKEWHSELYHVPLEQFIEEMNIYIDTTHVLRQASDLR